MKLLLLVLLALNVVYGTTSPTARD